MDSAASPAPEANTSKGGGENFKPPDKRKPEAWHPLGVLSASVTPDGLVLFRLICQKVPSGQILAALAEMQVALVVHA
jgi:hypothetical protein